MRFKLSCLLLPNEQEAGNNWYHDHAIGITIERLCGTGRHLQIIDPDSEEEEALVKNMENKLPKMKPNFWLLLTRHLNKMGSFLPS